MKIGNMYDKFYLLAICSPPSIRSNVTRERVALSLPNFKSIIVMFSGISLKTFEKTWTLKPHFNYLFIIRKYWFNFPSDEMSFVVRHPAPINQITVSFQNILQLYETRFFVKIINTLMRYPKSLMNFVAVRMMKEEQSSQTEYQ